MWSAHLRARIGVVSQLAHIVESRGVEIPVRADDVTVVLTGGAGCRGHPGWQQHLHGHRAARLRERLRLYYAHLRARSGADSQGAVQVGAPTVDLVNDWTCARDCCSTDL